jgi:hypothetical protein
VVIRHLQRYQSRGAEQFLTLLRQHVHVHDGAVEVQPTSS